MRKQLLISSFASQAWAMDSGHLSNFANVLRRWSAGVPVSADTMAEIEAHKEARTARASSRSSIGGGIAVIPLYGVMTQRANMVDDVSGAGGTSTEVFSAALRSAIDDDSVGGIIIDIDSPGGSVFGAAELADLIFQCRDKKPIYGFVNSLCASAAYWAGSQCSKMFITQGGMAGSIGVYVQHVDESAALESQGYKVQFVSAGKYKVEGNALGPLDDEAGAFLQSTVDTYYAAFTAAVARGRSVSLTKVQGGMGQGRCLMAQDAVDQDMVDGICSFQDVVNKLSRAMKSGSGSRADVDINISATSGALVESISAVVPMPIGADKIKSAQRQRQIELASI